MQYSVQYSLNCCVQYSVQYSIQYIVQYRVQYRVQYSVQFSVQNIVQYALSGHLFYSLQVPDPDPSITANGDELPLRHHKLLDGALHDRTGAGRWQVSAVCTWWQVSLQCLPGGR